MDIQRIQERAYALWIEDGRLDGRADDHWFRAERELAGGAKSAPAGANENRARPKKAPARQRASKQRAA